VIDHIGSFRSAPLPAGCRLAKASGVTMLPGFGKIVEERILAAQRRGEFENLSGHGKPLDFSDDSHVVEELRLAYKILKNADCLPPELELKKEVRQAEELLRAMPESAEKYHAIKKLNFLILKLNSLRKTPVMFEEQQHYSSKLVERLDASGRVTNELEAGKPGGWKAG
jgi:hypothetical protein